MNFSHILFDLDGTLTDPKIGITKSVQYALAKFGIIEDNLDRLEPFIGPPLTHSFKEFYNFSEEDAWQAVQYYREYFADKGIFENQLYPGIPELLTMLTQQQAVLIVATSKPLVFAEKILKHFELEHFFHAVVGSNLDGTLSDKSEIIRYIIEQENLNTADTVMIGDRKHDIIGAHNNGISSIGVLYGYGSEAEMEAIAPTYCIHTVQELHEAFASNEKGRQSVISIQRIDRDHLPGLSLLFEELMGRKTNDAKLAEAFESLEQDEQYILLGAFHGEVLAGSLMGIICQDLVGECRPFMVIENVVVASRFRRQGIGRRLMLEIEQTARSRDCSYIIFVSGGQRKEAHKLYEHLGYKEESVEGFRKHL